MSVFSRLRNQTLGWWHEVPLPTREADATPIFQLWHRFDPSSNKWVPLDSPSSITDEEHGPGENGKLPGDSKFVLVTWNVDATSSAPKARISALISHIENMATLADIIFLQEVSRPALSTLLETPWLREHWYSSEMDTTKWGKQSFATMTLVSRARFSDSGNAANHTPALDPIWRVNYPSHFERDALCCDILLPSKSTESPSRIRLINAHLDSLPINPSLRPRQLSIISSYLRAAGNGLVAGDFNPVLLEDDALVNANGLVDAWTKLNPNEDGFTWGADGNEPFPPNRLDKVAMVGLKACDIQIIPSGRVIEQTAASSLEQRREQRHDNGSGLRWSDHSGLLCSFEL